MLALDCPTRAELDSFQAGDLDEAALTAVASHVESCSKCQRSLETIIGDSSDTILAALLAEPVVNPFAVEVACRHVIDRVSSMAGDQRLSRKESALTIALKNPRNPAGESTLPVETIREYKLLAKLGEGGMGAVYKALHTRLDKVVALKVLPEGRTRDAGSVARFQREMKAVGRLDHPNIVRAMDAGEENGTHFLVMEYVEGADLSELAKNIGPLPVADACELVRQAAVGLQEAHEHGMVHRDIKPSNLILTKPARKKSPPTLKILDLGLALLGEALSADQGLTSTGQMMGTIDYMAPEQGSDTHNVDIRADIYSLGATLYRLLTGSAPFAGVKFDTPVKKILALATKEPAAVQTLRADVPPALATIVHKMLAKDPAQRFATPEELADALAPFCQGANLAALLERGNRAADSKVSGEAPTHPQLSSPSAATAPTIDYSIKARSKAAPASRSILGGLGRKVPRPITIAAACGGLALAALLGIVFYLETLKGTIRIEINDDKIKVVLDEKGATFEGIDKRHSVRVQPGPHGLTITRGDLKFDTDKFELRKGETLRLSVTFLAGRVHVVDAANGKSLGNSSWHGWPKDAPAPAIAPFDAKQAQKHQEEWAAYLGVPMEYENSIGMKFVLIPPGEFVMGSTSAEIDEAIKSVGEGIHWRQCVKSEAPQHSVTLTKPFFLGIHEVTQAEYQRVMGKNPSHFAKTGPDRPWAEMVAGMDTARHPVEWVSWNDAAEFCTKLSEQERQKPFYFRSGEAVTMLKGAGYRLPTEAEWEFACRAGTTTRYWIGNKDDELLESGWFNANAGSRTHAIGEMKANPMGLYDIHGNVGEWVQDCWEPTYYGQLQEKPTIDPSGPNSADSGRVFRGGFWYFASSICRSSARLAHPPSFHSFDLGFRAALTVDAVKVAIAERNTKPTIASSGWHGWPKDAPKPAISPFDAMQARKHQEEWATYLGVPVEYENSLRMKFVLIPPGEYLMGSPAAELDELVKAWDPNDKRGPVCLKSATPQHRVILTRPAYASVHEVTQKNYQSVMGNNPSVFVKTGESKEFAEKVAGMDTADFAVDSVSWLDATDFCSTLSRREKLQPCYDRVENKVTLREANGYRLPSEAEWEFSCRAGSTTPYSVGDGNENLIKAGWFGENSGGRRHAVGELQANPFGLFDLHGNAWEWVQDWWEPSYQKPMKGQAAVDPQNESLTGKSERVLRGGNWRGIASLCRSSVRDSRDFWHRHQDYGFRVWLSLDAVKAAIAARTAKPLIATAGWHGWPADAPQPAIAPFTAEQAKMHQQEWATYLKVDVEYRNSLGMKFVLIPPGEFTMGSTPEEIEKAIKDAGDNKNLQDSARSEGPQHKVILTQPMYLGVHEVTQGNYEQVMGSNPAYFAKDGRERDNVAKVFGMDTTLHPVEGLRWEEAVDFCTKLSELEKLTPFQHPAGDSTSKSVGTGYRLPTEALWEFACRAGTTTKYSFGDKDEDLPQAGWFRGNADWRTHKVGELKANPLGLFDMHGNVWEWMQDGFEPAYYGQFLDKPAQDPSGPTPDGTNRILRGGAWNSVAPLCGSSRRFASGTNVNYYDYGFRVALTVDAVKAEFAERKANPAAASTGWQGWPADAPKPAIAPFTAEQAKKHQQEWAAYLNVEVEYKNSLGMKFVLIPPGEFMMGNTPEEAQAVIAIHPQEDYWKKVTLSSAPAHRVRLTQPYYLGTYEVSQGEYEKVVGRNPAFFSPQGGGREKVGGAATQQNPIETVTAVDAAEFCNQLSEQEKISPAYSQAKKLLLSEPPLGYRLPTEAEWESACRAGTTTPWVSGEQESAVSKLAWLRSNSGGVTHAVGQLQPNPLGLYDMHGNVWEWCQDWHRQDTYALRGAGITENPQGPASGAARVLRGGSWESDSADLRAASRALPFSNRQSRYGFRVALSVDAVRNLLDLKGPALPGAEPRVKPAAVDREANGTVFPAYAATPLHLVKQKEDFAAVREELELLRKSSKKNYHVVILPTLGDYLPRAADYLCTLAEEWQQEAVARKEPFDAERLVIILMAMNDQQLQIHFGSKLKDGLGLEGPPVTKELLVPHFLPFAKQGKLSEGLVSLLRGTGKWIAEREAAKDDKSK